MVGGFASDGADEPLGVAVGSGPPEGWPSCCGTRRSRCGPAARPAAARVRRRHRASAGSTTSTNAPSRPTTGAVSGHWEGDLVTGKGDRSALATVVERTSRFLVPVPLRGRDAVIAAVSDLPASIKRFLTWDCGSEVAMNAEVAAAELPVFFAHPHSPWERGSNEKLNCIVRDFLPMASTSPPIPVTSPPSPPRSTADPERSTTGKTSEVFTEIEADASTA
ncbi:IS30 family transposase [Saccharothrix lopnurensis]|uniref:IS30 family transposase n=1 Tax=Saccharothrix lopnurensis TaxID=1670621 RepID=A0ABW1PFE6_9PSEU